MSITTNARRGTAIVASLGAAALLTLGTASAGSASGSRDSDHDGMPNHWEVVHHLDPHRANARGNPDHDGLRNIGEFRHGTRPHSADTDDDGIEDGQEDTDGDGIDDAEDEVEDNCQGDEDVSGHGGDGVRAPVLYIVR